MQHLVRSALAAMATFAVSTSAFAAAPANDGIVIARGADYVSPPSAPERFFLDARQRPLLPAWKPGDPIREIPRRFHGEEETQRHPAAPLNAVPAGDLLVALQRQAARVADGFTTPLINRDAQPNAGSYPPDPSGDVGGGYYVQSINGAGGASYVVYRTQDGSVAAGPFDMANLGSGGACASGYGDGVVLFDALARRWLLSEFAEVGNNLCVYISAGDDPVTTTWTRYVFTTPNFPDYPKYGIWPDAYYVGANEGPAVYALDRAKMLAAQPATLQRKAVPRLGGLGFQMTVPASVQGTTPPPAGSPGLFGRQNDDERTRPGSNDPSQDFLELFTLQVDWTTPANTTLTGPIRIGEAEFDSRFTVSGFGAIHQPGTGTTLDPLLEVLMFPLSYRNFGDHESLIGNHVTQIQSGNIAGIRWFELRRSGGAAGTWSLYQQGTFAPTDAGGPISRWMGAIGIDQAGSIALGYSVARAAPAVYPGLRYVGRRAGDPAGVMSTAETSLIEGSSSQSGIDRWGDYFQMGVDADDGCTFWFTGMYQPAGGSWTTRIGAFRFDGCTNSADFTLTGTNLDQSVCAATPAATALQPVALSVAPVNGFAAPVALSFAAPGLPAGFAGHFTVNPIAPPATTSEADINVGSTAAPGPHVLTLRGSANGADRDVALHVDVATQVPAQVALNAPADNATGQPAQPVFSWAASAQAASYRIDIATDAAFAHTLLSQSLAGGSTSFQPSAALPSGTRLYWRVIATNTCGDAAPSAVFSFITQGTGIAAIDVSPATLETRVAAGQSTSAALAIANLGSADLIWTADTAATDCATPATVAWLSPAPQSGTVHAGDAPAAVAVAMNAGALTAGIYTASICVHSNDPAHALVAVPVRLSVTAPGACTIADTIFCDGFDGAAGASQARAQTANAAASAASRRSGGLSPSPGPH